MPDTQLIPCYHQLQALEPSDVLCNPVPAPVTKRPLGKGGARPGSPQPIPPNTHVEKEYHQLQSSSKRRWI
jgi:hypothetical protein